jgi:hypothetical protein
MIGRLVAHFRQVFIITFLFNHRTTDAIHENANLVRISSDVCATDNKVL